jgi:tetratricopeptide (TPR) repeat protein
MAKRAAKKAARTQGRDHRPGARATATAGGLGERVRLLRRQRGLSQEALAGSALTAAYVSLIESGKRTPTPTTIAHLAEALETTPRFLTDGIEETALAEATLALRYAELALHSGEAAQAEREFATLARTVEHPGVKRDAEWGLARALELTGRLEQAIAAYERLTANATDDPSFDVSVVIALARCYREVGDFAHSIDLAERVLDRIGALGLAGSDLEVQLTSTLAAAYAERGDLVRAAHIAAQAIDRAERAGSTRARGSAYWNASLLANSSGHVTEAIGLAERALALLGENNDERNLARLRTAYAGLLLRAAAPRTDPAIELLEQARTALADTGSEVDLAYCETELARAHLLNDEPQRAIDQTQHALARLAEGQRVERTPARLVLLRALVAAGDTEAAEVLLEELAAELESAEPSRVTATAWREIGEVAQQLGDPERACDCYARSLAAVGIVSETVAARTAVRANSH